MRAWGLRVLAAAGLVLICGVSAAAPFVGSGTGLTGDYCNRNGGNYDDPCLSSPDVTRVDATVDFSNGDSGWPASGIGEETFSTRWTGQIQAQYSEDYRIHTISDDGIRVWIDGQLVIDNYTLHDDTEDISAPISLTRGQKYDIEIRHFENTGEEDARLLWSSPSTAPQSSPVVVPQHQLYPTTGPEPLLAYRMEAGSWSGTGGEVTDETGNGHHGTAYGGATTASGNPAIAGDPGTCRYGTFDGNGDYVEESGAASYLAGKTAVTVMAWVRNIDAVGNDRGVFTTAAPDGQDNRLGMRYDASGTSTGNSELIKASINTDACADGSDCLQVETTGNLQVRDQWQHLAMTWESGDKIRVYVDGNEVATTVTGSGIGVHNGSLDGIDFLRVGQGAKAGSPSAEWQGQIDEFRIYDQALAQSDIQAARNETHPCQPSGRPFAYYSMDALPNDSGGQVADDSGNGYTGQTLGGAVGTTTAEGRVCSAVEIPRNTASGQQDAVDTGIDVDGELGDSGSINFWYYANTRWSQPNEDRQLLDASTTASGQKYFFLALYDGARGQGRRGGRLQFGLEDSSDADFTLETNRFDFSGGSWHHIGITWDFGANSMAIYVDGSLAASQSISSNGTSGGFDTLYLGDNRSSYYVSASNPNSADGRIDEVRVYDYAIDQARMQSDMDATHPCGGPDHFELTHDGAGINCLPEPITLRAVDSAGNPVTGYTGTVDLTTTTGNGSWAVNTGSGSLSDGTTDDGAASYTFVSGDNGEVILDLSDTHRETLNIDAADGSVTDDDSEGDITFRPYGFLVSPDPVPTQIAGRAFDLTLTAAGQTPSQPQCGVIQEYDGSQQLQFWFDYEDPGSGTRQVSVNGTAIATSEGAASDQTVAFSNGQATVPVNYTDVGEIQLHVKDDAGIGEPPSGSGGEIIGGSAPFVWRPFGFQVNAGGNPGATHAGGPVFTASGADFPVTVTARAYQAADDGDGDGVPDGFSDTDPTNNANLSDNPATPNYGQEASPEAAALGHSLVAPAGGNDRPLDPTEPLTVSGFSGGSATASGVSWPEVGIIELTAAVGDGDYLGTGQDVPGRSGHVGRFIPDHFLVDPGFVENRTNRACASKDPFTYLDERFLVNFDLSARTQGVLLTENYEGGFAKLDPGSFADLGYGARGKGSDRSARLASGSISGSFVQGAATIDADLSLAKQGGPEGPFDPLRLGVAPQDSDGVTLTTAALDLDVDGDGSNDHQEVAGSGTGAIPPLELRYGRLRLPNAYGPETANLDMDLVVEFHTAAGAWQVSQADNCTAYDATVFAVDGTPFGDGRDLGSAPARVAATDGSGPQGALSQGRAQPAFALECPGGSPGCPAGPGNQGWVEVTPASPGGRTASHYLDYLDFVPGYGTFGRYRGDDRMLYWREVYQ